MTRNPFLWRTYVQPLTQEAPKSAAELAVEKKQAQARKWRATKKAKQAALRDNTGSRFCVQIPGQADADKQQRIRGRM